jgi:LacI family transcriptional regulator
VTDTPTLRDVARLAGVSLGTASQAINNRPNVATETRARVMGAAAQLGYQIPDRSKNPISVFTEINTIAALVKITPHLNPPIDPFNQLILSGAERECQSRGIRLMYTGIEVDLHSAVQQIPSLELNKNDNGLLLIGGYLSETMSQYVKQHNLPLVLVDSYSESDFDRVLTDNFKGAFDAVSYLIQQRHRRIGLIGCNADSYPSIRQRREGYLRALEAHGIDQQYIEESDLFGASGYNATFSLLQREPEISAIFVCNDDTALGVMRAAREMHRKIPDDLSLIAFDDLAPVSEMMSLATMHIDKMLMGTLGTRLLIERIQNPDRVPITVTLGARLIPRESVGLFQSR